MYIILKEDSFTMAYQPKSYRKFLATSVSAALVATVAAPAIPSADAATNFTDQSDIPSWAEAGIAYLVEKGAIKGYPDGSFQPDNAITRAEAAQILSISLGLDVDENAVADFPDTQNHWGTAYIAALV